MPDRNPTLPLYRSLRLRKKNCCILLMPFLHCHAHLWGGKEKRGGKGRALGGGGVNEIWWWMMMRDELLFTFLHEGILGARGWHSVKFLLYFCLLFAYLLFKWTSFWDFALRLCSFRKKIKTLRNGKMDDKNKINWKTIREISRERKIEQIQLIRGWLKN